MSRTASFLIACLIYASFFALMVFLLQERAGIAYGNSTIEVLLVDDAGDLAVNEQALQIPKIQQKEELFPDSSDKTNNSQQDTKPAKSTPDEAVAFSDEAGDIQPEPSMEDLFANIDIKTPTVAPRPTRSIESSPKASQSAAKAASSKMSSNISNSASRAQVVGLYDKYFGRINAYLKNKWSLVLAASPKLNENDIQIVDFVIDRSGVLKILDFVSNSFAINRAAKEFARLVNEDASNFGPPPGAKEFAGKARLGIRFSAAIK